MPTRSLRGMALAQVILVGGIIANGFYSAAHAQCAPEDKIYIEPRLVPRPPSPEACRALGLSGPHPGDEYLARQCSQRGQPIVVPYGTGKVLVHPTNPCIQQYIP
jgi:hypothetical protein